MSMFCFQCQETAGNKACTVRGVCGKEESTANLQDLLIYCLKGIALWHQKGKEYGINLPSKGRFLMEGLFTTITNANWDDETISTRIEEALEHRNALRDAFLEGYQQEKGEPCRDTMHHAATWEPESRDDFLEKAVGVGILATENEDVRSLRELLIIGLKGIAAYGDHAAVLGYEDQSIYDFFMKAMASTTKDLSVDAMVQLVFQSGEQAVATMALLDKANTETYGAPEITEVNLGVRHNPAILISGHDLRDMQDLLEQTQGTGVDVYTHSEMLPAHYYPAFKKYDHFVGNYGNAWWLQDKEFGPFNGPILMTTNCLVPLKENTPYKDRIFTTGMAGHSCIPHIPEREEGKSKDFSAIIELAKKCPPPEEIEKGTLVGGFAHNQVMALADKVVGAVKSGAIKRFIVMGGCDGRQKGRSYFTEVAEQLPKDTVILTAGCAKYRYNKLELGDIGGIPRVLDAGQCNDSYSLAVIALKLKEVFGADDINDLPLSFDIAWYEQKAAAVLLALLHLGVKDIRLGPTLPAFLSPNVVKVLVETFNIQPITTPSEDIAAMMAGR